MAETYTWELSAEDGVYKSHALSNALLEASAGDFRVVPFTDKVKEFGKKMGDTVTLVHYKEVDEPTSAQLSEHIRIPIDKLEMGTRSITILPWGRGIEYSSLAEDLSKFSPDEGAQKRLLRQCKGCMDTAAAAAFKEAKVCFIPTSLTGGTWDTDGTPSTAATVNMTKDHLACIRDYLSYNLHAPYFRDTDSYIGLFATKAMRGLKDDRVIDSWYKYLKKGDKIYKSELGRCEDIRLMEITREAAFSNGVGTGSVLGSGVVFGDEAVSRIEAGFPHLRADPNYASDFGRIKAVAWYGLVAYATTWNTADDYYSKIIRVTSS